MNRITKRIMALMLSLVMVLGCVPSFDNEVSAVSDTITINYDEPDNLDELKGLLDKSKFSINDEVSIGDIDILPLNEIRRLAGSTQEEQYKGFSILMLSFGLSSECTKIVINGEDVTNNKIENEGYQPIHACMENNWYGWYAKDEAYKVYIKFDIAYSFDITLDNIVPGESVDKITAILDKDIDPFDFKTTDNLKLYDEDGTDITDSSSTLFELDKTYYLECRFVSRNLGNINIKKGSKAVIDFDTDIPSSLVSEYDTNVKGHKCEYKFQGEYIYQVRLKFTVKKMDVKVDYTKPDSFSKYINIRKDDVTIVLPNDMNVEKSITETDLYSITNNPNFLGYFILQTTLDFNSKEERDKIDHVYLRNIDLGKPTLSTEEILQNAASINYGLIKNGNSQIIILEKFDFRKTATITIPEKPGTTVAEVKQSISDTFTTTASVGSGQIQTSTITDVETGKALSEDDKVLEDGKEYLVQIEIFDAENFAYNSIKVNNTILSYMDFMNPDVKNNHYGFPMGANKIYAYYKFKSQSVSSGSSKKYKASDNKDTAGKVSGSGKKGSTRTITPIEGKKVSSVIVTDKDGNKIDVTLNEDGTYSFKQPASDVNIEVNYKNREITLNIGSTTADVDGEKSNLDVAPVIRNDRTMLPIRFVAENLGAKVGWNEKNPNIVTITRGDIEITIHLGSDKAYVNGKEYKLDSVAFAENDRTYLPVRFVSEALNAIVEWNEEKPNEVKIYER